MINPLFRNFFLAVTALILFFALISCKHKRKIQKPETVVISDTLTGKCRLDFKSAKTLIKYIKENEFDYQWLYAKANVESLVDGKEESFDIKVKIRKDSAIWVEIEVIGGLIDVARLLITKDSVKMVDYIHKTYFKGDFNYINDALHADLDYDVIQAVLFGNSAEFHDDETKLKPVTDRQNCHYLLSTERKRKLRKIQQGETELKKALQTITLNPDSYKIIKNEFIDPAVNRSFTANYRNFTQKDSVYAPYNVDIEVVAEKKANVKIEYVRIEKNKPQKISLKIPPKYDPIEAPKKQK
jgi:hypothetical protein